MAFITYCLPVLILGCLAACRQPDAKAPAELNDPAPAPPSTPVIADRFSFPVGNGKLPTPAKDKADQWFAAREFAELDHLGEDWNKNSGGNSDCGEPVYSAANGQIAFADNAGPGWGNVVIITHTLSDGSRVQTLYGHLQKILKTSGNVGIREQIGTIGNAEGRYLCHLHLEVRNETSRAWGQAGPGYAADRTGWLDPSDFIASRVAK